jgi:hypothetical protein
MAPSGGRPQGRDCRSSSPGGDNRHALPQFDVEIMPGATPRYHNVWVLSGLMGKLCVDKHNTQAAATPATVSRQPRRSVRAGRNPYCSRIAP